jgi:hypothetical protein
MFLYSFSLPDSPRCPFRSMTENLKRRGYAVAAKMQVHVDVVDDDEG